MTLKICVAHDNPDIGLFDCARDARHTVDESKNEEAATMMQQIEWAWVNGRGEDLASMVHPEIVMVFPSFTARIEGRLF